MLVCGSSFAGLAVARELAAAGPMSSGRRPLRAGRAGHLGLCGAAAMARGHGRGGGDSPGDTAHELPHPLRLGALPAALELGGVRLPRALPAPPAQADVRFEIATVRGRDDRGVSTDRGCLSAPLVVDALAGAVLASGPNQPPEAPLSRGLEVHPDGGGIDPDVWIDRSLVRHGYGWSALAGGEQRVGVAPTSRATTSGRAGGGAQGRLQARRGAPSGNCSPTACGPPPRAASSWATRPDTASRSRVRASGRRSTSGSPAAASCGASWRASEAPTRRCAAMPRSARHTAGRSASPCVCSG